MMSLAVEPKDLKMSERPIIWALGILIFGSLGAMGVLVAVELFRNSI